MKIWKEFHFDSAHLLPFLPDGHKCRRLHGHTFRVRVEVAGAIGADGLVMDFADIAAVVDPIIERLDQTIQRAMAGADVKSQFSGQGIEPAVLRSEAFGTFIRQDTEKWARVVKAAGVKAD